MNNINEKLPEIGQRVICVVLKEMIYMGNNSENESDWLDDDNGLHIIMFWEDIKNKEKYTNVN